MPVLTPWLSRSRCPSDLPVNLKSSNSARQSWLWANALRARSSSQGSWVRSWSQYRVTARSATRNRAQLYIGSFEITSSILRQHFSSAGMTRGSPVASWYWVSALNRGNSGQTSYGLCFCASPTGPSQPSGCWRSRMVPIAFLTLASIAGSSRRKASGTSPSSQYGTRSQPSALPPNQALSLMSGQNSSRWPLSPSAWMRSCSLSQPAGLMLPSGRGLESRRDRDRLGALRRLAGPRAASHHPDDPDPDQHQHALSPHHVENPR